MTNAVKKSKRRRYSAREYSLLPFLVPALIMGVIFNYIPMIGVLMGFKTKLNLFVYTPVEAFVRAEWTTEHFRQIFFNQGFVQALSNTLFISVLKIVVLFPLPILFAILITEINSKRAMRTYQTIMYLPHFLSWAVVTGIFMKLLSSDGLVNTVLINIGLMDPASPTLWFQDPSKFVGLLLFTEGWKEIGWSMIIYVSAIMAIDQDMIEAAKIDGAGKMTQIWHITLPAIKTTIITMFILRIAYLMDAGFTQIYTMHTVATSARWQILGTYIFKLGIQEGNYAFSSAMSLFNSLVGLMLVMSGNFITKRLSGKGIV